jgi:hypothetical protein
MPYPKAQRSIASISVFNSSSIKYEVFTLAFLYIFFLLRITESGATKTYISLN